MFIDILKTTLKILNLIWIKTKLNDELYIPQKIMKGILLKMTFYLQNLHFYQNLQTDTSEPFSTVYNGIICNHLFWHETAHIKQNPILQNLKKTL